MIVLGNLLHFKLYTAKCPPRYMHLLHDAVDAQSGQWKIQNSKTTIGWNPLATSSSLSISYFFAPHSRLSACPSFPPFEASQLIAKFLFRPQTTTCCSLSGQKQPAACIIVSSLHRSSFVSTCSEAPDAPWGRRSVQGRRSSSSWRNYILLVKVSYTCRGRVRVLQSRIIMTEPSCGVLRWLWDTSIV
jgi:hypothetical protein